VDDEASAEALMARAAARNQISLGVLRELMALEREFPDFTQFGSKAAFARRVAQILDKANAARDAGRDG